MLWLVGGAFDFGALSLVCSSCCFCCHTLLFVVAIHMCFGAPFIDVAVVVVVVVEVSMPFCDWLCFVRFPMALYSVSVARKCLYFQVEVVLEELKTQTLLFISCLLILLSVFTLLSLSTISCCYLCCLSSCFCCDTILIVLVPHPLAMRFSEKHFQKDMFYIL